MEDKDKDEYEIIRPDDPRYKEMVSQSKDKGVSLVGGLHIIEGMLAECKRLKKAGAKTTIPGLATDDDNGTPARPIDERIAELEKMVEEAKEVIEWAEAKRPGSSRTENGSLLMQEYDEEKGNK